MALFNAFTTGSGDICKHRTKFLGGLAFGGVPDVMDASRTPGDEGASA